MALASLRPLSKRRSVDATPVPVEDLLPDVRAAADAKQQLRLCWRFKDDTTWQTNTVDSGYTKNGQLAIRLCDGAYANEVCAFPEKGVEYAFAEPLQQVAVAIASAATAMTRETTAARRERTDQRAALESTALAVDSIQNRLTLEREANRVRADELSAQETSLLLQQSDLSKNFAVAITKITTERQTLIDTREELLSSLEVARAAVRSATAEQAAATQQQQEAIEKRLAEVKKALDDKNVLPTRRKQRGRSVRLLIALRLTCGNI